MPHGGKQRHHLAWRMVRSIRGVITIMTTSNINSRFEHPAGTVHPMTLPTPLRHATFSGEVAVVASSRVPPGRRFEPRQEAELHTHMYELAQRFGDHQSDLIAIPEFPGPFGVADLAVMATSWNRLCERIEADISPITHELDAAIVANLNPKRARTQGELATALFLSENALNRRLTHLQRAGAVHRSRTGRFTRHEALMPLGRVYAIESKVRAWRRALDQARTYALWSDRSIAMLGMLPTDPSVAIKEAQCAGLGLAIESTWLVQPRATQQSPARRMWTSELFFAALLAPRD